LSKSVETSSGGLPATVNGQWDALLPGVKPPGHEADHSPSSCAAVRNKSSLTSTPSLTYVFMVGIRTLCLPIPLQINRNSNVTLVFKLNLKLRIGLQAINVHVCNAPVRAQECLTTQCWWLLVGVATANQCVR